MVLKQEFNTYKCVKYTDEMRFFLEASRTLPTAGISGGLRVGFLFLERRH